MKKRLLCLMVLWMTMALCACGGAEFEGEWAGLRDDRVALEIRANGTALFCDAAKEGGPVYKGSWEAKEEKLYIEIGVAGSTRCLVACWEKASEYEKEALTELGVKGVSRVLWLDAGSGAYALYRK